MFTQQREKIRSLYLAEEDACLRDLIKRADISEQTRSASCILAAKIITDIRNDNQPGMMEVFLAEYGLSTSEGVALMCLAEALLRVPDAQTIDDLIEDKIAPSSWGEHLGQSASPLVNASTWGLMLTGKVLNDDDSRGIAKTLHGMVKRIGEPVIRVAVKRAMKEMGRQFVLGETIADALDHARPQQKAGFTYSYDMLGEAALTAEDAEIYFKAYENAITALTRSATSEDIRKNPGISIKLSALHPRYETRQASRVLTELVPRVKYLCGLAKAGGLGLNIDAEEADRLDISLDIVQALMEDETLSDWAGLGIVVQAYGKRASATIDCLYDMACHYDRQIMVRLVKGAYWDTEIKRAQVEGLSGFPVFTRKSATDVSYICCAQQLLNMRDRIYPQFATHNAHSVAAILKLADDYDSFEFQRLHGMGSVLHRLVMAEFGTRCRIYAPVGAHEDLLAYLVRRLLENGANSSFVNQIVDPDFPVETIASDPFLEFEDGAHRLPVYINMPSDLFLPERVNSKGWDVQDPEQLEQLDVYRAQFYDCMWNTQPIIASERIAGFTQAIHNPADPNDCVGYVEEASAADIEAALEHAKTWVVTGRVRQHLLRAIADLYEDNAVELFSLLMREAGKTLQDAVGEVREAIDFLRYYAAQIDTLDPDASPRGTFVCISPWNFPLAIFTGQIAAALAAGNAVIAKPAEPTALIAGLAVKLMHKAGVPVTALQFLPGEGRKVGAKLVESAQTSGICFTGSTATAQYIYKSQAQYQDIDAPIIAETGGINAMIVDSTALPEQAVKDILDSAFQSAGQRCSALRVLFLQDDIAPKFLNMLYGAMDELTLGAPWSFETDIGPIITEAAKADIQTYIDDAHANGRVLKTLRTPKVGNFIGPTVISVKKMSEVSREIFGPVLHVCQFKAKDIDGILQDIKATGYGLTFGLHSRIDDRVEDIVSDMTVGNLYINRNQIGAIVGSQPFGGEGLSGTGPKAGGPHYLKRFVKNIDITAFDGVNDDADISHEPLALEDIQAIISTMGAVPKSLLSSTNMPGPTGESNRLSTYAKGVVLCLGPSFHDARAQVDIALSVGCQPVIITPDVPEHKLQAQNVIKGRIRPDDIRKLDGFYGLAYWANDAVARELKLALSERRGPIIQLLWPDDMAMMSVHERHICIDTTASGGNVSLLSAASDFEEQMLLAS